MKVKDLAKKLNELVEEGEGEKEIVRWGETGESKPCLKHYSEFYPHMEKDDCDEKQDIYVL